MEVVVEQELECGRKAGNNLFITLLFAGLFLFGRDFLLVVSRNSVSGQAAVLDSFVGLVIGADQHDLFAIDECGRDVFGGK